MIRRQLALMALGALTAAGITVATPADAMPLERVVQTIRDAGGRYQWGAATLAAADCSGLVSIAQTLAMGQKPHRLGDTGSLLAGRWPHAIPGAKPGDLFVIGANQRHMVAQIRGINIEARQRGEKFRVGADAASPFEPRFSLYHIDPAVLA